MPDPIAAALGHLGYVRRDQVGVPVRREQDAAVEPVDYPQVIIVQGHTPGESWVRDHAGQLVVGAVGAVLGLAALAVVALVAVVATIGAVSCVAALTIAKTAITAASQGRK